MVLGVALRMRMALMGGCSKEPADLTCEPSVPTNVDRIQVSDLKLWLQ